MLNGLQRVSTFSSTVHGKYGSCGITDSGYIHQTVFHCIYNRVCTHRAKRFNGITTLKLRLWAEVTFKACFQCGEYRSQAMVFAAFKPHWKTLPAAVCGGCSNCC